MKFILVFLAFGAALCFPRSTKTKKPESKDVSQRREFVAKAKKFIDELKAMFYKGIAIDNNNSATADEKLKAFAALEKENPKVYYVLYVIHMQFMTAINVPGKKDSMVVASPVANVKEWKKEVRADVFKLIAGLNAALKRKIDILDNKSKTSVEKLKSLAKLTEEDPKMDYVLQRMIGALSLVK